MHCCKDLPICDKLKFVESGLHKILVEMRNDMIKDKSEEIEKNILDYQKACKDNNYPNFLPSSGVCYNCHNQLFEKPVHYGETYCRFCNHSYCD